MAEYDEFIRAPVDRPDTRIAIRFDKRAGRPVRFVVQLQYLYDPPEPGDWYTIAQTDHAPADSGGHDLYQEGLHVDIYRMGYPNVKVWPDHTALPESPGALIRTCTNYFQDHHNWFFEVAYGHTDPVDPPEFSD